MCFSLPVETTVLFIKIEADTWFYLIDCGLVSPLQIRRLAKAKGETPLGRSWGEQYLKRRSEWSKKELGKSRALEMEAEAKPNVLYKNLIHYDLGKGWDLIWVTAFWNSIGLHLCPIIILVCLIHFIWATKRQQIYNVWKKKQLYFRSSILLLEDDIALLCFQLCLKAISRELGGGAAPVFCRSVGMMCLTLLH